MRDMCEAIAASMRNIEKLLTEASFPNDDDRDEALYLFLAAQRSIHTWKCHQLRSVRQDQARLDVLELLDDSTLLIVNDWAMKFLPQMYREAQSDWFGKRGISWHISVVYRRVLGELQYQSFIHVIQTCSQDTSADITIMQHVLHSIRNEYPNITKAFFRQDNAGCYHSSATLLACPAIEAATGVKVVGVDFSDPQGGKGAADSMAATAKNHMHMFINEGNDITNVQQMKEALLSYGGIEGVRVAAVEHLEGHDLTIEQPKIPEISRLNNFHFASGKLVAARAYGIGNEKQTDVKLTAGKKTCNKNL